jgi:hypothetical protein
MSKFSTALSLSILSSPFFFFFVEGLLDLKSCGVFLRPVRAGVHDILRLQVDGVHVNDPIRSFPSRTELAEKPLTYSKVAGSFPTKAGGPRLSQILFVESFVLSDQLRKMHIVYLSEYKLILYKSQIFQSNSLIKSKLNLTIERNTSL